MVEGARALKEKRSTTGQLLNESDVTALMRQPRITRDSRLGDTLQPT